jgi:hypothetical protein
VSESSKAAGSRKGPAFYFKSKEKIYMTRLARYLFGVENAEMISTRTIGGQHWYMAATICELLGIANHSQAVHREREADELTLTNSEWRKETIFTGRRKKHILLVNNGGMLKLIYQAKSPVAIEIQKRIGEIPKHLIPAEWADYMTTEY